MDEANLWDSLLIFSAFGAGILVGVQLGELIKRWMA